MPRSKPLIDWTDEEVKAKLRAMHEASRHSNSPNDLYAELHRRTKSRHDRVSTVASVSSAIVATVAVVLSAVALIMGAARMTR